MSTGIENIDELLEKLERLANEDILVFNTHNGKIYMGEEYVPRSRAATVADIEAAYTAALGKKAASHPDYIEPSLVLEVLTEAMAQEAVAEREAARASGKYFGSVAEFVAYWLDKLHATIGDNDLIHVDPEHFIGMQGASNSVGIGLLANFLKIKLSEYNHTSEDKDLKREDIQALLDIELYRRKKSKLESVRKVIAYTQTSDTYSSEELMKWAKGLLSVYFITHGENSSVRDEDATVLLHFLWQIKRKIFSLPIESELIYSFYSLQQGMGKTHLVRALCQPFQWGYNTANVSEILNPNDRIAMCREKFVIDMIELAKVEDRGDNVNAVASLFKSLVSNTGGSGVAVHALRGFHTQTKLVEEQTTVFVTTTNIKVATVIQDNDMRRFWEFVMNPPKNFDTEFFFNANPYLDDIENIYRSIDETDRFGFYHHNHPTLKSIYAGCRVIQKAMAKSNALCEWMDLQGISVSDEEEEGEGYVKMTIRAFHRKFQAYKTAEGCDSHFFTPFYVLSILTSKLGIEPIIEQVNGTATKMIYVKGLKK